jgi:hypothetical protein
MRIRAIALHVVTAGLDPAVHSEAQRASETELRMRRGRMNCRVKPGNDERRKRARVIPDSAYVHLVN